MSSIYMTSEGYGILNKFRETMKKLENADENELKAAAKSPTIYQWLRECLGGWSEADSNRYYLRIVARETLKKGKMPSLDYFFEHC